MLRVVEPGIATTIQDAGRSGLAHLGVPPSGVIDPGLAGLVNRIVGNPSDAAAFETVGGLLVEAVTPVVVATSAHAAPVVVRAGDRVWLPHGGGRQWHYLAVRGGLDVPVVLGSRSHDTISGLGPAPVLAGTTWPVGPEPDDPVADFAPIGAVASRARIGPGPRAGWFVGDPLEQLAARPLTVAASSRIGVRLHGATLERRHRRELPSEGLVRGAIQVPPDGDPIMMLADHPTTGGYPVVAVVHPDDVAVVAQHPAGSQVQLTLR